jgi:hypothetical protein
LHDQSETAEPSSGDAQLARTLGEGIVQLLPELPAFRGITPLGELSVAFSVDGRSALAVALAAQLGAKLGADFTRKEQYDKSPWIAKHIFVSQQRKLLQEQQVQFRAGLFAVAAGGLVAATIHGARVAGERADRARAAAMVDSLVTLSYVAPDGTVPERNAALRRGILDSFHVSEKARKRILDTPPPATLWEVGQLDIPENMQETIAALLFEAHAGALGGSTPQVVDKVQEFLIPVMMATKMSESSARALLSARAEKYLDPAGTRSYQAHYQLLQAAVAGIGCDLGLSVDVITDALRRVAENDPYEEGRRANRAIIRSLIESAGDLSALQSGGIGKAATTIALKVATHLLSSADGPDAGTIKQAWKKYQVVQGITVPGAK